MSSRPQLATEAEREQLRQLVDQWNENRLDLFSLSYPTEDLEIHGVMRFYFQESKEKVSTKCIRVSSTATTRAVIEALIDKFHPDLKMLSDPEYTLWEVHENGEERCLAPSEKPLLVQLNWHKDDREGRFLLRAHPNTASAMKISNVENSSQKRFSKKEGKELKKKHQKAVVQEPKCAAEELYKALPPTTFTRTISNPEVVMKKRREKKIAAKLRDLGQGGSLKIYGYELEPNRPYITLLVSVRDRVSKVLEETLEKYGISNRLEDYVLVEMVIPASAKLSRSLSDLRTLNICLHERIMDYDECPLISLANRTPDPSSEVLFVVKNRPPHVPIRRTRHASLSSTTALSVGYADPRGLCRGTPQIIRMQNQFAVRPCLLQLSMDGKVMPGRKPIHLPFGVMDIGSDHSMSLFLEGEHIRPRHAVINYQNGVVTITASDSNAEIEVDGRRICQTVALRDCNIICIGRTYLFRYLSTWDAVRYQLGSENNDRSEMNSGLTNCESPSSPKMETTFDIGGNTVSTPLDAHGAAAKRFSHPFGSSSSLHLLGRPLPGLAPDMKFKSMTDIRLAAAKNYELALSRATSSDALNQLLKPAPATNGGISGAVSSSAVSQLGMEKHQMYAASMLPALVEVGEEVEDEFLHQLICPEREDVQFRLTPAYAVYMVARHRLLFPSHTLPVADSRARLQLFLTKAANRFLLISKQRRSHGSLAFWLANSSELLNFYKQDVDLSVLSRGMPQQILAGCVESTFEMLGTALKSDLNITLNPVRDAFLDDRSAARGVVAALEEVMRLLRQSRLNAALTIQLFSQLFYYISAVLFNWLVSPVGAPYCSRAFGVRLRTRLGYLNEWAYQQGLELAAECHMDRINQAVTVLVTPKIVDEISNLGATCYKLNSIQVRWLLDHFVLDVGEEPLSRELIESIVRLAEAHADMMAAQDGLPVQLEEELQLQLPFLLPQDGYTPDLIRGLSPAFSEILSSLQAQGLCRFFPQNHSSGSWTVFFKTSTTAAAEVALKAADSLQSLQNKGSNGPIMSKSETDTLTNSLHEQNPQLQSERMSLSSTNSSRPDRFTEIVNISINRGTGGIGLSIVAAQGIGDRSVGIYVKKVVSGSAAHQDGRLESGDQLLSVNGQSLIGISQEEAASKMASSGPIVSFEVYKNAARYNGLLEWLSNPPPAAGRAMQQINQPPSPGRQSVITANVAANSNYVPNANTQQRFLRQNSVASTVSSYSTQSHFAKPARNGHPATMTTGAYRMRSQYAPTTPETQLIKNRSASTSDIYQNQADAASMVSLTSLQSRTGTTDVFTSQYERYQSNATGGSQRNTMPSHYRNIRPVVIQPSRPTPSPVLRQQQHQQARSRSPSHLYSSSASSSNHYQNSALRNALSSEYALSSASSSPIIDYANLPLIEDQHHSAFESSYSSSSASHSIIPNQHSFSYAALTQQPLEIIRPFHANSASRSLASTSSHDSLHPSTTATQNLGGSADEIPAERPKHRVIKKSPPPVPPKRRTRRDELNEQLDQLESKGAAMTEADHQKYRELVNELAKIRIPLPIPSESKSISEQGQSKSVPAKTGRTMEDEDCVERPKKFLVKSDTSKVDEINGKLEKVAVGSEEELSEQKKDSSPNLENSEEARRKKKGVQWDDGKVEVNVERPESSSTNSKLIYEDDDQLEPRAQVLGTQEVYRDPRQKRLELEAKQQAAESKIDGSKLGFRDKMQLFAEQIGDRTLKNRYKASAVQREIEQTINDS